MHALSNPSNFARTGLALFCAGLVTIIFAGGCSTGPAPRPGAAEVPSARPADASAPASAARETILFDGKTLNGWAITDFAGHGEVQVQDGRITLGSGVMTGVNWTNDLPKMNYEISLDAMRVDGSDFFCGLTFPVGEDPCSLIVGGWGGGVVGLSSLDSQDAANNETTKYMNFENGRWFKIRVRVTPNKIEAWIDNDKVVDADTTGRKLSIRMEVEPSKPLGVATWATTGAVRDIKLRRL